MMRRKTREGLIRTVLLVCALSSLVFLGGIMLVLISQGLQTFRFVDPLRFIFGLHWYPTHEDPSFGILPMIYGSVLVTFGALLISVPLGVASALYISEAAPPWFKEFIKPAVELLAGIPSVVYGLFGALLIAPLVQRFLGVPTGLTAFSAALVLAIMTLPTITSISEDAISSIPNDYKEAALALGATRWEVMTRVTLPAALSGITTAVILGIGRAIGETMAVLMVAGGSTKIYLDFLKPTRTITATIAAEMAETVIGGQHYYALFGIAIVLFVLTLTFNIVADRVSQRFHNKLARIK